MNTLVKEVTAGNKTLKIFSSVHPSNPRENDDGLVSTMICFHKKYNLGDKTEYRKEDYQSWAELHQAIIKDHKPLVLLPLFLYDHSGITISTKPFSCPWDSGQIGYVIVTKKRLDKVGLRLHNDENYQAFLERLVKLVEAEIAVYNLYLQGEVYAFQLYEDDVEIESCDGFYGDNWEENGLAAYINDKQLITQL